MSAITSVHQNGFLSYPTGLAILYYPNRSLRVPGFFVFPKISEIKSRTKGTAVSSCLVKTDALFTFHFRLLQFFLKFTVYL